ncbi:hypothetical protein BDZ45DRAFT_679450 [Acephala macrosclerotiorum]|nr:hypothetical protein BDZ45DRAFT_679450 [Acephala macrosclerotiorum]
MASFEGHHDAKSPMETAVSFQVECHTCGQAYSSTPDESWVKCWKLNYHTRTSGHLAWACENPSCTKSFLTERERDAHQGRPHVTGHGRPNPDKPNDCTECRESFASNAKMIQYTSKHLHQPFGCECESLGTDIPKYPCTYCKRHRGLNGFRRRDHLLQHVRNYHLERDVDGYRKVFLVCPHSDYSFHRDQALMNSTNAGTNKPFPSQSEYTKHMREEYNGSTFPCAVPGYNRIGKCGYFREGPQGPPSPGASYCTTLI